MVFGETFKRERIVGYIKIKGNEHEPRGLSSLNLKKKKEKEFRG